MALFTGSVSTATAKAFGITVLQIVSTEFIKSYFDNESPLIKLNLISVLERLIAMNKLRNMLI